MRPVCASPLQRSLRLLISTGGELYFCCVGYPGVAAQSVPPYSGGKIMRLPNIFESIEYAPGPRRERAIITRADIENSSDLCSSHAGQQIASKMTENAQVIGVKTPNKSRRLIREKTPIFHTLTFSIVEFWNMESMSIPMTQTRNRNSATPGSPSGNIEKSRCTGS